MGNAGLVGIIDARVEALGYEVVELERAGSRHRPILRLRIDRPAGNEATGITHEDCRAVSRDLEELLDARADLIAPTYVIEVSSPGVERPLVRAADFERFAGRPVVLQGSAPLAGRARRLEGELLGLGGEAEDSVRMRLENGEEIEVPRAEITRAQLAFHWGGGGRS
jgi:ribosome maturation factor RimP